MALKDRKMAAHGIEPSGNACGVARTRSRQIKWRSHTSSYSIGA